MTSATCVQTHTIATAEAVPGAGRDRRGPGRRRRRASPSVAIVGGSGYTGALLAELLLRHPSVKLAAVSSETLAGQPVRQHLPRVRSGLAFCGQAEVGGVDVAFVCTPHGEAARGRRGGCSTTASRSSTSAPTSVSAPRPTPSGTASTRIPSCCPASTVSPSCTATRSPARDLVANPGCYPTAALLALAPLKQLGLVDVIIDAKSGVSGAGKTPKSATHFCSVDSDLVAYGVQSHRHYPEIVAGLVAVSPVLATGRLRARWAPARRGAPRRAGALAHLRAAPRAAAARHQRDHLRADEHAAAAERGRARGALRGLLRRRDLRRGLRRAAGAQGRRRHQLLPDLPARGRRGPAGSSSSASSTT